MTSKVIPMLVGLALALSFAHVSPVAAQARDRYDARELPLHGFTTRDLRRVAPMLRHGVVGLVQHDNGPILAGIHLAISIDAPASVVASILTHPEGYPAFMPALSQVTIQEREGNSVAYAWRWQTSIFSLGGRAMQTVFAPPAGQERRGWRIAVERTEGDLGHGREIWRVRPAGPNRCVLTLSTRMDLRDANSVTRTMAAAGQSLSRSITLAMGLGMVLRTQAEAERRAGRPARTVSDQLRRPDIDMAHLEPLLRRGEVLLIEAAGTEIRQAAVMTRYERPEAQVRSIMLDPVAFTQALIQGSSASVADERTPEGLRFEWRVDLPLIGTSGAMLLRERDGGLIELDAVEGALDGGRWRFETTSLPSGATGVFGWARFEVASANFLLRAVVEADRGLRAGLSAATEVMMARALRIRLRMMRPDEVHVPAH